MHTALKHRLAQSDSDKRTYDAKRIRRETRLQTRKINAEEAINDLLNRRLVHNVKHSFLKNEPTIEFRHKPWGKRSRRFTIYTHEGVIRAYTDHGPGNHYHKIEKYRLTLNDYDRFYREEILELPR